jgi:biotin operon repressor
MLVLKLLSLLQDGDPPLAQDIGHSRTAIWEILADPKKFVESNLMAGA